MASTDYLGLIMTKYLLLGETRIADMLISSADMASLQLCFTASQG